jgi:repressor LexA
MPRKSKIMQQRLEKILDYIIAYQDEHGSPPSIREIGDRINVTSTSQVSFYLEKLETLDYITKRDNVSRSIQVTKEGMDFLGIEPAEEEEVKQPVSLREQIEAISQYLWKVPVRGRIVASEPLPMPDDPDFHDDDMTIEVARSLFGINENPDELFALEVDGDSMIDAMINDGDVVIFRKANEVRNGEMAAIWIDDDNTTTLKYFYQEKDHYRLEPANPTMEDIIIPKEKHLRIMGKVVAVVRQIGTAA